MARLWSPVKSGPEMQDSVHERRGGGRDVEGADATAAGKPDQLVAGGGHARPKAPALRAEHENHATAVVRSVVLDLRIRRRAVDPGVALLRLGEPVGEVPHPRHR